MNIIPTPISELFIVEPRVFSDSRGYFFESYNDASFRKNGLNYTFIQDNQSESKFGTLRGLHFQYGKYAQAKLVRVISGAVWDVAVDLRRESMTFGKYFGIELTGENKKQLLIPRGFAHGFITLSEKAVLSYKCDNAYAPQADGGIFWNDPDLKIPWRLEKEDIITSEKDALLPGFFEVRNKV